MVAAVASASFALGFAATSLAWHPDEYYAISHHLDIGEGVGSGYDSFCQEWNENVIHKNVTNRWSRLVWINTGGGWEVVWDSQRQDSGIGIADTDWVKKLHCRNISQIDYWVSCRGHWYWDPHCV